MGHWGWELLQGAGDKHESSWPALQTQGSREQGGRRQGGVACMTRDRGHHRVGGGTQTTLGGSGRAPAVLGHRSQPHTVLHGLLGDPGTSLPAPQSSRRAGPVGHRVQACPAAAGPGPGPGPGPSLPPAGLAPGSGTWPKSSQATTLTVQSPCRGGTPRRPAWLRIWGGVGGSRKSRVRAWTASKVFIWIVPWL